MQENLKNLIKKLVSEIQEEELEEMTTTGDVDGYNTPMAFTGKKGKKKKKKISTNSTGYKVVKEAIDEKDLQSIKKIIRIEVADILRDIWLKRNTWR